MCELGNVFRLHVCRELNGCLHIPLVADTECFYIIVPHVGSGAIGKFSVPAIHLLISALYMHVCVLFVLFLFAYLSYFPFLFSFFLLTFTYLLPSRIWTRSISRPEFVGGNRTWV